MKQRILTTVLALLAIVTGVQAGVKLGDNEITASGTVSSSYIKSGSVSYNKTTNTLTLNNATINVGSHNAIYFTSDGTLVIIGTNSVTGNIGLLFDGYNLNIRLNNNQSGSVTFVGSSENCGIFVGRSSTLAINEGCFVTAQGGWGIAGADGTWDETVTINKATVHATGTQGSICDLLTFTLTDCGITSPAGAAFTGTGVKVNGTVVTSEVVIEPGVSIDEDHFPDANFRSRLASTSIDKNGDGFLTDSEIAQITSLNVYQQNIADLTGIEYFTALTSLDCRKNQLTSLNVSQNTALTSLDCRNNQFTSLDVSQNTALKNFYCSNNQLTQLDVSQNTALITLYCDGNQLTQLDVSHNPSLKNFSCFLNRINDDNMTALVESMPTLPSGSTGTFYAYKFEDNEQNECYVYHANVAAAKGWTVKSYTGYTLSDFAGNPIPIDEAHFPDAEFRRYLSRNTIDTDADGYLSEEEIAAVTSMDISSWGIQSLQGIEYFTALMYFNCNYSHVTELDLTKNMALKSVSCSECKQLQQLSLPKTETLTTVNCNDSHLMTLELTGIPNLQTLKCENNSLTQLFVNNHTALTTLACYGNNLQALGITGCSALTDVWANRNLLTALNLEGCSALKFLSIYKNQIKQTAMDNIISQLPTRSGSAPATITLLYTGEGGEGNEYSSENVEDAETKHWRVYGFDGTNAQSITADYVKIDPYYEGTNYIKNFPDENFRNYVKTYCDTNGNGVLSMQEVAAVKQIHVSGTHITSLKGVEFFTELTELNCRGCGVSSLDISKNVKLTNLDCSGNPDLESLDITANTFLQSIQCHECSLTAETMSALLYALPAAASECNIWIYRRPGDGIIEFNDISLTAAQVSALNANNWHIYIINSNGVREEVTTGVVRISPAYFPDNAFRTYIKAVFDTNGDLLLTDDEALGADEMYINEKGISDLTGIERFTNLETLWCQDNQLTTLDLSNFSKLTTLYCQNNQLQMLDVTGTDLYEVKCYGNQIKGDLMQVLISSLPADRTQDAILTVYDTADNEGNDRPTSAQIAEAEGKRWRVVTADDTQLQPLKSVQINSMNFPDANFRSYVSQKCDTDGDGTLSAEELEAVTKMLIYERQIEDLKGIEYFTALETLNCTNNDITTLDISKNIQLRVFWCASNQLTTLDVSNNKMLTELNCGRNELTSLDVSKNTALTKLDCHNNNLSTLDLSHNPALEQVGCAHNLLTELDFSHNPVVNDIDCSENTILDEKMETLIQSLPTVTNGEITIFLNSFYTENNITVAQIHEANTKGWKVSKFPYNILRMPSDSVEINATYFPDANFRRFVSQNYDADKNGFLNNNELRDVDEMDVSGMNIADLTGLGFFSNLETLDCHNNQLTSLDLSYFNYLTNVVCYQNRIQGDNMEAFVNDLLKAWYNDVESGTLIIRSTLSGEQNDAPTDKQIITANNKNWQIYTYDGNSYTTVETSEVEINSTNFPDAKFRIYVSLNCDTDGNGSLSYQEIQKVTKISVSSMEIGSLKGIEYFTALDYLDCQDNDLQELDLSQNTALTYLDCYGNNLTALDVSQNTALTELKCGSNSLAALDVLQNTALTYLSCSNNNLQELDVSQNMALNNLACSANALTTLDVSKNTALKNLYCNFNQLSTLDLKNNKLLTYIQCLCNNINGNGMQALVESLPTVANGTLKPIYDDSPTEHNHMTTEQAAIATSKGWQVKNVGSEDFEELFAINATTFPDENFRNYVSENFDTDHNGNLSRMEADAVEVIHVADMNINDLTGIACFSQLKELYCNNNNGFDPRSTDNNIVTLDLSGNPELTRIACGQNWTLESLNIANCTKLENLHCANNNLSSLDVTHNTKLWRLQCWNNKLTAINLSNNPLLKEFNCGRNQLNTLDVSNHTALEDLSFYENPVTSLDVSGCTSLWNLSISDVPLTTVDLSTNTGLRSLTICNTQLSSIDLSHNTALTDLSVAKNSRLGSIDLQYNTALDSLWFSQNDFTAFPDLSHNRALTLLYYNNNTQDGEIILPNLPLLKIAQFTNSQLTKLNVTAYPALEYLYCFNNQLTSLDVSSNTALETLYCYNNQLSALDLSHNTALKYLMCQENQLTSLDLSHNTALKLLDCSISQISSLVVSPEAENLVNIYCYDSQLRGGKAVDDLIESLPDLSSTDYYGGIWFRELDNDYEEHNYCSYDQVLAAYNKGWWFAEYTDGNWYSYWGTTIITGDVNGDNQVTIADVTALVNIILGKTTDYDISVADVNGDNNVTIADVTALVNIILGKTPSPSKVKAKRTADADTQGVQSAVQTALPENAAIRAPRSSKVAPKKIREGIADDLMPRIRQKQTVK